MTIQLRESLSPAEQAVWDVAEKGEASGGKPQLKADAVDGGDALRLRLLEVLAHQNGGDHKGAFAATGGIPVSDVRALDIWRRAERIFAGRKRQLELDVSLTAEEAGSLGGGPLEQLAAARAFLALGLTAIQENRGADAGAHLDRARDLFLDVGSSAGRAVTETELGKLRAWQGRSEEAILSLTTALNIWGAQGSEKAADVWHEIGALLLDGRRYKQAIDIFEAVQRNKFSTRTQNALTRALIGDGQLEAALPQAQAVLQEERNIRLAAKNDAKPDPYREIMALRDIGEIAIRRGFAMKDGGADPVKSSPSNAQAMVAQAEQALQEGALLLGFQRTDQNPVFPKWVRQVDGGPQISLTGEVTKDPKEFEKLRLVQLELLIDSFAKPEGAGRNLAKLAESFSRRFEVFQELEAREQAATAFTLAGNTSAAARQLEMAHRIAAARGQSNIARSLRARLAETVAGGSRAELAAPGVIPLGALHASRFRTVISGLDQESGRRVLIHRYSVPASAAKKAEEGLKALEDLRRQRRVLVGLPELLDVVMHERKGNDLSFDLVTEDVGGEPMEEAMKSEIRDLKRPIRVVRSLAATIGALHQIGIGDCRPSADLVLLDLGDAPIWTDLLPIHDGKADDDVKLLAGLLVSWFGGGPGERSRLMWKGGKNGGPFKPTVFPPGHVANSIPPGLETMLSAILLGKGDRPKSPGAFADELEKYS
jgi:tetratricopeptide (TPR) repeat protein